MFTNILSSIAILSQIDDRQTDTQTKWTLVAAVTWYMYFFSKNYECLDVEIMFINILSSIAILSEDWWQTDKHPNKLNASFSSYMIYAFFS